MSKKAGLAILFYPSFDNSEEFTDHYYRMIWYLNPLRERVRRVIMPYKGEAPTLGELPYYLDPAIKQMAGGSDIVNAVELVSSNNSDPLQSAAREADIVLVWRTDSGQGDRVPDGPLKHIIMRKRRYLVDHKHEKGAGSHYLRLSSGLCSNKATVEECKERFKRISTDISKKIGYIYGTGPSLKSAVEMDLSDGTSIVCNTIVKNKELMRKLKPPIITVADPIFHGGCSRYAGDFRRHLIEAMVEYNSYLIVPMRDYALYMANLDHSLQDRIIGVPIIPPSLSPNVTPNLNLYKKFQVAPATSILMLFLIPLAATFFEKTFVLGCDGRPVNQNDYFWKHDPASQLVDRMDDIQIAHPAFFAIDYHDFYLEHCRQVARWLDEAERQGRRFFSLTPSYIPALKSRYVAPSGVPAEPPRGSAKGQMHIISLNPQLIDSLGHPLAYDMQLSSACAQRGMAFASAASARIDTGLIKSHPYLHAIFSDEPYRSGVVRGDIEPPAVTVERFRREAQAFLDEYLETCEPEDKVILYFYTGGLPHIEVLHDIIKERPQVSAHITLFYLGLRPISHETLRRRWAEPLMKALFESRLALSVLTAEMQRELQAAVGIVLPVAPAPSATFDDIEAKSVVERSGLRMPGETEGTKLSILFPGLMRRAKGYDLSISIVRMLRKKQTDTSYECTLRYVPHKDTPPDLVSIAHEARHFANVIEGVLPPDEFRRMLKEADIVVLPYQPSEFSNRTSSILIEALLCGVPVVVQKGTWLGNFVAEHDCGVLAGKASPKAYVKAIAQVSANHARYRENAVSAAKKWLQFNNWASLIDFIIDPPAPLDAPQAKIPAGQQGKIRNILDRVFWRRGVRGTSLEDSILCQRLVGYLMRNFPSTITIGRFVKWGLAVLKNTLFGIGGMALLVIVALYVAGALVEPARWYLVGFASALILLCGGLLGLFYLRSVLNRLVSDQRKQEANIKKALHETEAALKKEVADNRGTLARLNVGNFPLFQELNRRLTKQDLKHFAKEWVPKLGLNLNFAALGYIAHRICLAEDTCVGRLAGSIETMLLRVLVARSVREPTLEVLEIGTLFGTGVAMIHENCRGLFDRQHFTVIDPLVGHIGSNVQGTLDSWIKVPATREIFIHNMQRMNIPELDYTIIQKLSTEAEAIEEASKKRYDLLIIDGDHSDSGVRHDFFSYGNLVKPGGYIIFDDYGNPRWPGLTRFVDEHVAKMPELEFVGTDVFAAVFRVIASQDSVQMR